MVDKFHTVSLHPPPSNSSSPRHPPPICLLSPPCQQNLVSLVHSSHSSLCCIVTRCTRCPWDGTTLPIYVSSIYSVLSLKAISLADNVSREIFIVFFCLAVVLMWAENGEIFQRTMLVTLYLKQTFSCWCTWIHVTVIALPNRDASGREDVNTWRQWFTCWFTWDTATHHP